MSSTNGRERQGPRCIALVGPYLSGKTTLLEAIMFRLGAIQRQGKVSDKTSIGDAAPEARAHGMSIELNAATGSFMGETFTFIDCPGSIEFGQEARAALAGCDAAVVVCEPDDKKVPALQLILKQLDDLNIPRFIFINKIERTESRLRDVLTYLQPASATPLLLRQIPIWKDDIVRGFVDLALERAFIYRENAPSEVVDMPADILDREKEARFAMLEKLADYDDELMEQLLSDIEPPRDRVFTDLTRELAEGLITPVLFGSAENGNGILRLMKALRHEAPGVAVTAKRLGLSAGNGSANGTAALQILKTFHTAHGGKLSLSRVLSGAIADGATVYGGKGQDARVAGLFTLMGSTPQKIAKAEEGDTVALGKLDNMATGETISTAKAAAKQLATLNVAPGVYGLAISVADRKDEVKLTSAIAKLIEEDPSLSLDQNSSTHEMVLWGQGEMHLRVALEKLQGKFGVQAISRPRRIDYRETIRKSVQIRGRHKKQSGGHGQFGDIVVEIKPLARGSGFAFTDTITGGVVPKQYIPAVETGIRDWMGQGPLGFPVVDFTVNLSDGSYHDVDSSEMAFKTAARIAMSDGMPQCSPVLLEPIVAVEVHVPSEATSRVNQIVSGHRGQLLGFDGRDGWLGWDTVKAHMPESEMGSLIIELRSATSGVGTFVFKHDHMSELTGRLADQVVTNRKATLAA
ncbi:elongation factor G [Nordella sp. HKS 07]|uniref:elongation factor G n=1 Tax=Nordella sp. HKS 07 TaxID=2712222 RepID=UPI0013E13298|nr:elongation factor G [Nordella sp. HKS 07]QIG46414.1 elongation factor G [Nordella sp. HKS 07]